MTCGEHLNNVISYLGNFLVGNPWPRDGSLWRSVECGELGTASGVWTRLGVDGGVKGNLGGE
jgi:hypothetical protein